jgi:hypothetical protein
MEGVKNGSVRIIGGIYASRIDGFFINTNVEKGYEFSP